MGEPGLDKFHGLGLEELALVRVFHALDHLGASGEAPALVRPHAHTDGNTCHFALNGVVSNHVYGKFDGDYVVIAPLAGTLATGNQISGLRAEDTWFHYDGQGKLPLPENLAVVVPAGAELPGQWVQRAVFYDASSDDPSARRAARNAAARAQLERMGFPVRMVGMWNWEGESINSCEPDPGFLARLGGAVNVATHANSPEEAFAHHERYLRTVIDEALKGVLPQDRWGNEREVAPVVQEQLQAMREAKERHVRISRCERAKAFFQARIESALDHMALVMPAPPPPPESATLRGLSRVLQPASASSRADVEPPTLRPR